MNALLLPGNSARHSEWIEALKAAVAPSFQRTETQHYRHWQTGEPEADIDYEISVAQEKVRQLEPYTIIAKSIGTVIAVKAAAEGKINPQKLILLGVPIKGGVSAGVFAEWLKEIAVPVIVVQNVGDPLGSFAEVRSAFEGTGREVSFVELAASTHNYLDFDAITRLI